QESQIVQAGDAVLADAAGHNAGEVRQVRIDVQADAVKRHAAPHAHADRCDLVFLCAAHHPDADAAFPPLARHIERGESPDQPFLEPAHEAAHVAAAPPEVQHDIADALARPVIGELSAAACPE